MTARVIDGSSLAGQIRQDTIAKLTRLRESGAVVRLDAILVGDSDAAAIYAQSQARRCRKVGIDYHLHSLDRSCTNAELQDFIAGLSRDPQVTGIMLNLPLPDHLDAPAAQYTIDPYKDVEGVNPANIGLMFYGTPIIAPCTALAVMFVLREIGLDIRGKNTVVIGQGDIVGKPITLGLIGQGATVIACNEYTHRMGDLTRMADVVIAAAGVPGLVGAEHVKEGAAVIDVGISRLPGDPQAGTESRVVGDVRFDEVKDIASVITPVPGGVGPITVAILLHSAVEAAAKQLATRRIQ